MSSLFRLDFDGEWPMCFHDRTKPCGHPETRGTGGPTDLAIVSRGWHVADLCETPSCPVRCAIRDVLAVKRAENAGLVYEILMSDGRSVEVPTRQEWEQWPSALRRVRKVEADD